jgi:hypothetical protein
VCQASLQRRGKIVLGELPPFRTGARVQLPHEGGWERRRWRP